MSNTVYPSPSPSPNSNNDHGKANHNSHLKCRDRCKCTCPKLNGKFKYPLCRVPNPNNPSTLTHSKIHSNNNVRSNK